MAKGTTTKNNSTKTSPLQPAAGSNLREWKIEKIVMPIIVGVLGCMAVILASVLSGPIIENILEDISPTPTITPSVPKLKIIPFPNKAGDKIFFLRSNDYYMMTLDGTYQTLIADYPQAYILCPSVSSDGEKLVLNSNIEGFADIYTINRDGTDLNNITNTIGYDEVCASWAPDQKRILFYRQYSISADVFIVDADGKNVTNLTNVFKMDTDIENSITECAWSPDGTRFVYQSQGIGSVNIFMYDFTNGTTTQITNSTTGAYKASWSPDGTKIVYTGIVKGDDYDIFVLDLTQISSLPAVGINISNNPAHETDATWSPDSNQIAFISDRDGNAEIYIMDIDGTNIKKITNTPEKEGRPRWIR